MRIGAQKLFDGTRWLGPSVLTIHGGVIEEISRWDGVESVDHGSEVLLPGLIDSGAVVEGYLEGPAHGMPFLPEEAFAALSLAAGVTTVIDLGAGPNALAYFEELAAEGKAPMVFSSGARLVTEPTQRIDRVVRASTVESQLDALQAGDAALIRIGQMDQHLMAGIVESAHRRGMTVANSLHREPDAPGLVATKPDGTKWLIPQMQAHAVWDVPGMLQETEAGRARTFLPYARHFQSRRGVVGRGIARDVLRRLYGDRPEITPPTAETVGSAVEVGRCVAASGAGGVALVPGHSLWDELGRLGRVESVLATATSVASDLWELAVGRIEPGAPADLVLLHQVEVESNPRSWRSAIKAVVAGGVLASVEDLESRLTQLVSVQEESSI